MAPVLAPGEIVLYIKEKGCVRWIEAKGPVGDRNAEIKQSQLALAQLLWHQMLVIYDRSVPGSKPQAGMGGHHM